MLRFKLIENLIIHNKIHKLCSRKRTYNMHKQKYIGASFDFKKFLTVYYKQFHILLTIRGLDGHF